eukprot:162480_1
MDTLEKSSESGTKRKVEALGDTEMPPHKKQKLNPCANVMAMQPNSPMRIANPAKLIETAAVRRNPAIDLWGAILHVSRHELMYLMMRNLYIGSLKRQLYDKLTPAKCLLCFTVII